MPDDAVATPDDPTPEITADGADKVTDADAMTGTADHESDAVADAPDPVAPDAERVGGEQADTTQADATDTNTADMSAASSDTAPGASPADEGEPDDLVEPDDEVAPHSAQKPVADSEPDVEPHEAPVQRLKRSFRPTVSRSQVMVGLLCALLGFAVVVQVRQSGQEALSSLRQDDLVRLLDEVTVRADQLDGEVTRLRASRDELASGSGQAQAALDVARQRATSEGILSGRLPAQGPGVIVTIREPDSSNQLKAQHLFNLLEELRNAGAEVVQVNDVRLVASSSFVDGADGSIMIDGEPLSRPYRWRVIGDPATLDRALEIPGGALPTIRSAGAAAATEQLDEVTIDAVVELTDPRFAQPAPDGENG